MSEDKYLKKLETIKSKINNAPQISSSATSKKQIPINKAFDRIKKEAGYGFTIDDVNAWESSVNDMLKRADEYLSTDSYRVADRNIESEIKKLINDTDSVSNFLHSNSKYIEDYEKVFDSVGNTKNALSAYLNGVRSVNDVFSQYATEDDYNKAVIGWLNEKADVDEESASARQDYYNSNVSKAEEIDDSLPWYGNSSWIPNFVEDWFLSDEEEALRDESERIEAENNQYERTQYGVDKNYFEITPEVEQIASNRRFLAEEDALGKYLGIADESNVSRYMKDEIDRATRIHGGGAGWNMLKDDEITRYYYLYNTEGKDAAYKYLEDMSPILTKRATQKRADELSDAEWYEQILLNIASVPMDLVGNIVGTIGDVANFVSGNELDPYDGAHVLSNDASAIRQDTAQDIDEALGGASIPWLDYSVGDVYSAMMSIGDSVVASFIPNGNVLLGLGAAQSTMKDIYDRGGSAGQMLASGIMAGVAESFFEKYSIGELNKIKKMDKASVKGLVDTFVRGTIMGGVEASEEMATEIVNTLTDSIVMGSQSNWTTAEDFLKNVLNAGIGGFLSGGATGSFGTLTKYVGNKIDQNNIGKEVIDRGQVGNLLTEAGTIKESGKVVDKLLDKYGKKGKISASEAYRLLEITDNAKAKSAIETELKNRGEKGDVSAIADAVVKQARGDKLSKKEQALIDGSVFAKERTPLEQNASAVTENATAKENATEGKFEGATEAELVANIARDKKKTLKGFTEEAESAMVNGYTGEVTPSEYSEAFTNAYKMGASGVPSSALVRIVNSKAISERTAFIAYVLGQNSNKALQNVSNNGTINSQINDGGNNDEGIRLRDSGKRNGSENSEGQVSAVESGSGQAESRRKTARIADKEAARLLNEGREVKVADLGILGGSKEQTVRVLENVEETESMKKARDEAEASGVKVTFFVGDNLVIEQGGELISARAYITLNGKHVFVRVDHSNYTAEQLMGHELGHYKIHKGEVDINAVRERIKELVDGEYDELAKLYEAAYAGSGYNADQIWEECICDSLGNMNVFSETESEKFIESLLPKVKTAAESTAKSPTQTRGSPDTSIYKTRDVKGGWGKKYATAQQALNEAIKITDSSLYAEFESEMQSGKSHTPITNAIIAVQEDVRQSTITPIQGAKLLSEVYQIGGANALERIYIGGTGNLYPKVLERAKQYSSDLSEAEEGKASREIIKRKTKLRNTVKYLSANKVGETNMNYINHQLISLYRGVSDGIADGIAIENGDVVYIVDSGRENGRIDFGVRLKKTISNKNLRADYIKERNDYAISNGQVSDGLSERLRNGLGYHTDSNLRRESGTELQTDKRESPNQQSRVSQENAYGKRRVSEKYSRELDTEYLSAVERGDMETAQRMVDEAAKAVGYDKLFYHGAKKGGGFNVFRDWSYFTENKQYAERYADREKKGSLYTTYVKLEKPFDTRKKADRAIFNEIWQEYGLSAIQDTGLPDWTDGYDISDYIDENELDYDGIVLDEGGDMVNGKPVSRGLSYVVRKSAQIKSADPVTYDDNGAVIPLSERFNTENADIRYSRELEIMDLINEQAGEKRETDNTKQQNVAQARDDLEKLNVGKGEIMALMKLADEMYENYNGQSTISDFRYGLFETTKVALNGIDEGLEAAYNIIHTLAREVAYNPKRLTGEAVILDSIQKQIKGARMSVSDVDKTSGEFTEYGGYNEFRKRHLGKFILANEGTKVAVQYQELQELYGEGYFPEVNTISEMLLRMAEIVDMPLSEYMAESESELDSIADGIAVTLFERLGDVWSKISRRGKVVINKTAIDQFSNRTLLANALETVVQNEVEAKKLEEYKANIDKMNAEQAKLNDLRAQIKEISFSKGKRDTEKLKALQEEATKTADRITDYDGKLLKLEATKALKDVLEREKLKAYRRAAQKGRERLHENVEGRRKTEARHKIINVTRDLDALLNRGTKDKNVKIDLRDLVSSALDISDRLFATDDELLLSGIKTDTTASEKDAIAEYLELYSEYHSYDDAVSENKEKRKELRSVMNELKKEFAGVLERERNRINEAQASTAYDALLTALKTLKGSDVSYISAALENVPEVFEYIETLKKKIGTKLVKDMTLEELNSLYKALKSVKHLVSNANKMFGAERNESLEALSVKAHAEVSKNKQKKYISAAEDSMSMLSWNNLKPIYLMERLKSETLVNLFADVLEGESQWARDVQDAHDYVEEQKKKYNYKDWDLKKLHEFTSNTGQTYELSLEQMLSIYAYVKRGEDALEHLRNGGFVFGKIKRKKKRGKDGKESKFEYYLNDKTAYKVPDTVIFEIIGNPINAEKGILTDEQKAYVDAMQEYLSSTMGAKGNEVSRQLYGIDLFTEENYLPMRSEKDFIEKARMQDEGKIKIKNKGFTKPLQKGANKPIVLEDFTDLWGSHVAEMSSYHAMALPLENLGRVLNYQNKTSQFENKKSLRTAIGNAFGDAAKKAVDQMIDDINGGARVDPREAGFKKAISLYKKAKVMLSLSVAIQQPTSILRAMALIDPKHFVGVPKFSNKHWNEIKQYAPVAIIKEMGHFDTGMGKSSSDWITGKSTWRDTVDNFSSWLPERADMITWIGIWNAVKRETASKNPKMNTNSKEFLELAGKRFEEIIRYTQVYDSTLSRSSNMRSKSGWMQMATSFLAEPTTSLNMREAALRSGNKKRIARTTAAIYSAALLNAILVALPYAMRDDDEDETFLEKYAASIASSFWGNINPIAALPFFRDIWSISLGYDVERTDMSLASDFLDSFEGMLREITKEETDSAAITDSVLKLLGDVSAMLGIPIGNLYREAKAIANTIGNASNEAESTLESVLDELYEMLQNEVPIWSKFPGETRGDKLYDAILEGDDVYVERLKGYYKDLNAVNSAIRKALREHDPRINEAAIALNNGERLEYNRIIDEIVDEGFFEEANVMSAILQEYEDMQPEEEVAEKESTEEKEQSRYEVIWVLEDILNLDITEANAMKEEIIQTHIDNGKSQREAENAFKSSFRTEVKNYYLEDRVDSSTALKLLMQHAGNTEEEALNKIQYWNFKKQYTDSALAESQVTKYYETIDKLGKSISTVLSVPEYEEALDKLAEATGVDLNGDGKADKDTKKKDIVSIIDSMPLTKEQKDALYYIKYPNGNIRKDTPWR